MNGSIAIWCEASEQKIAGLEPRMELHLNLWHKINRKGSSFVDIGFLVMEARQIRALNFYIPAVVQLDEVIDLYDVLKDDVTLTSVFNEGYALGAERDHSFDVLRDDDKIEFSVFRIRKQYDIEVRPLDHRKGCIVRFTESLFDEINRERKMTYIRFRLMLSGELREVFQDTTKPLESFLSSGFRTSDAVEIRVNEQRNFNEQLRAIRNKVPLIETVQYFLVTEMEADLTRSHEGFRKLRRLEAKVWDNYLRDVGTVSADKCIIYQWKKTAAKPGDVVEDFVALAFLASPRHNIFVYLFGILLLGVAGAAIQAASTLGLRGMYSWHVSAASEVHPEDSVLTQIIILGSTLVLFGLLAAFVLAKPLTAALRRWWRRFGSCVWR